MKRKTWKVVLGGLLTVIMVSSAVGCSSSNSGNNSKANSSGSTQKTTAKKEIKFFHRFPDEPNNSFIEKMVANYEAEHPDIDIVVTSAANDPYKEKIKVVMGSDDRPDIFFSWVGDFTNRFVREGLLLDITEEFEGNKEWKDSLIASQIEPFYSDGKLYGLPFRLDAKVFFYNIDIFEENGVKPPKTWDEFIEVCETLKSNGVTPIAYGNQELWPSSHYIGTFNSRLVNNETRLKDYDPTSGEFTDQGYVKALEYYQQMVPYFNEFVNGTSYEMARNQFATGQTAMSFMETIEIPMLAEEVSEDFNYGMFQFPTFSDGEGNQKFVTGAPEGFVISSSAKYPEETIDFLRYMTGPEVGKQQVREIGWFNASKGSVDGLDDQKLIDAYNIINEAEGLAYWLDNDLHAKLVNEYLTAVSDLTNGDVTPEQVMEKVRVVSEEVKEEVGSSTGE